MLECIFSSTEFLKDLNDIQSFILFFLGGNQKRKIRKKIIIFSGHPSGSTLHTNFIGGGPQQKIKKALKNPKKTCND